MYNHKKAQITCHEKMLRNHTIDPKADDNQAIWDKELDHKGYKETITEDQFGLVMAEQSTDIPIIEKVLNEAQGYIVHRSDAAELSVPPLNVLVEKKQQERMKDSWQTHKKSHWSLSFDDKKQQGVLPRFPKNAPQHDKIVLNNDPRRFENANTLPTHEKQSENDKNHAKKPEIKPLVGKITKSDIKDVAEKVKTGQSVEYDTAIVAILREADKESRELTAVEQKTVSNLKIARTQALLKMA